MNRARTVVGILLSLASTLAAGEASADATSAASAFFANLARFGHDASRKATVDRRTLVTGVYRLEDTNGELVGLITESGDIIGDSTGWRWITREGTRPLSDKESTQLRAEILQNIEWKRLIKVQYGDGGGRRILLLSAVNCPYCSRMEDTLARNAASINTTFYVLPISLSPSAASDNGRASWRQAASLWCADSASAWRRYWATKEVPSSTACRLDETGVFKMSRNFSTVMSSIGVRMSGTPAMIREDSSVATFPVDPDERYLREVLGPDWLRDLKQQQAKVTQPVKVTQWRWLVAPH
jgi:hypothetical protein